MRKARVGLTAKQWGGMRKWLQAKGAEELAKLWRGSSANVIAYLSHAAGFKGDKAISKAEAREACHYVGFDADEVFPVGFHHEPGLRAGDRVECE